MAGSKAVIQEMHRSMHECLDVVLEHAAGVPPELLGRQHAGFGHASLLEQLAHVLAAEAAWIHRLQRLPFRKEELDVLKTVDDIRRTKRSVQAATQAYLDSLDEQRLFGELEQYPDNWVGPRRSPAFIVQHVITHAFHHKGQIAAMLRLVGYPAPDTDMQRV